MTAESPTIRLERYSERHVEGLTALYNDPAVARQVLQMPYQSVEQRLKRLHDSVDDDRLLILVALHQGDVIGSASLEQHPRIRRSHSGSIGMGVAVAWQGKGVGSRLLGELLDIADNWMNLRRVELTVYTDNAPALALYRKFGFETEGRCATTRCGMGASWMCTAWRACGGSRGGWESEGRERREVAERRDLQTTQWLAGLPFHDRFVLGFGHTVTVDKQRGCYLGGEGA